MVDNNEKTPQENEKLANDFLEEEQPLTEEKEEKENKQEEAEEKVTIADPVNIKPGKHQRINPLQELVERFKYIFSKGPSFLKKPPVIMKPKNLIVKHPPKQAFNLNNKEGANKVALIKPKKISLIQPPPLPKKGAFVMPKKAAVSKKSNFNGLFINENFFETLLMVIIIIWLLRWIFGFNYLYGYKK